MAAVTKAIVFLRQILKIRRERRQRKLQILHYLRNRRKRIVQLCSSLLVLTDVKPKIPLIHSCRHLERTTRWSHWWDSVRSDYSEKRFRSTFRVSRKNFTSLLDRIAKDLKKATKTPQPVTPACRLGICLYRLACGDYYSTHSRCLALKLQQYSELLLRCARQLSFICSKCRGWSTHSC